MKYYAIKDETHKVIVESWEEAQSIIKECKSPKYKSFSIKEEALAYLDDIKFSDGVTEPKAYIDGSFNSKTSVYGFGAILIINNKEYRKKVRALIIYRTKTLGGYKITNKTTDQLMVTFIRNIFDLGFMFILHHPKIIYTDSIKINTNAISSLDGEQGDFSSCMVRISNKKIKIYANN